ncbi:MAG: fumarylacetoacetate hydrolase family protein [Candidatus Methanomethyliaceae archaeon]|nr:fumarylacetoacetate hydrolase family protein [Candidatus Methanomethyliaceae archaeon]MDW7970524.1 fumarylacetoacetate hydrolase family protein [Nitrososphaerota archaeon]
MRFATCEYKGATFPCVIKDNFAIKLSHFINISTMRDLLPFIEVANDEVLRKIESELKEIKMEVDNEIIFKLSDLKLRAPILRPPAVFCLGFNYRAHAPELKRSIPEEPIVFMKPSVSVIGPEDYIILPKASKRVDYEVELAIVIGRGGRYISKERAYESIFGYTILNDITARDIQEKDFALSRPWLRSKGFDTFAPIGPFIVTRDEIGYPIELELELRVNGNLRQKSNTREMIFDVKTIIEYISSFTTLESGTIIATGTPEKVGQLNEGDVVEAYVEKIGVLRNKVIREK